MVSPVPIMSPETVAARTAWANTTDSLQDLQFTPDATVSTPTGDVSGGPAVASFASGALEGAGYEGVALSIKKVFVCSDQVVIVEGDYHAMAADSGVRYPVMGRFLIRTIVDAQNHPHANLVQLSTTWLFRAGALASGCNEPPAYRYASRSHGIAIFGPGALTTAAQSHVFAELKYADWFCPLPDACPRKHWAQSAGPLAEAYVRVHPGYGIQVLVGRLWNVEARGWRAANNMSLAPGSGPLTLRNTIDALGGMLYYERRNVRLAAGPALLHSSWAFDANLYGGDTFGFDNARTSALNPALLGSATFTLPIGSWIDVDATAVGDLAGSVTPPGLLEFQPEAINASGVELFLGLGIRP
jgi:hypothetical protein